jgi:hypothetical protein
MVGLHAPLGIETAAYYTTAPPQTLSGRPISTRKEHKIRPRSARSTRAGEMRHFDSRWRRSG